MLCESIIIVFFLLYENDWCRNLSQNYFCTISLKFFNRFSCIQILDINSEVFQTVDDYSNFASSFTNLDKLRLSTCYGHEAWKFEKPYQEDVLMAFLERQIFINQSLR